MGSPSFSGLLRRGEEPCVLEKKEDVGMVGMVGGTVMSLGIGWGWVFSVDNR